jgi:hypothetical protein
MSVRECIDWSSLFGAFSGQINRLADAPPLPALGYRRSGSMWQAAHTFPSTFPGSAPSGGERTARWPFEKQPSGSLPKIPRG